MTPRSEAVRKRSHPRSTDGELGPGDRVLLFRFGEAESMRQAASWLRSVVTALLAEYSKVAVGPSVRVLIYSGDDASERFVVALRGDGEFLNAVVRKWRRPAGASRGPAESSTEIVKSLVFRGALAEGGFAYDSGDFLGDFRELFDRAGVPLVRIGEGMLDLAEGVFGEAGVWKTILAAMPTAAESAPISLARWTGEELENCLRTSAVVPQLGRLAIVGRLQSRRGDSPLIGVTEKGSLVVVAADGKRSRPEVVSAIVSGLALSDNAWPEDLEALCDVEHGTFRRVCQDAFGAVPEVTDTRAVAVVASTVRGLVQRPLKWLAELLATRDITVLFCTATKNGGSLALVEHDVSAIPFEGQVCEWLIFGNGASTVEKVVWAGDRWAGVEVSFCNGCMPCPEYPGQPQEEWGLPRAGAFVSREEWESRNARS
jgi:hypothetical protein